MSKEHVLKCWPESYEPLLAGRKTAEFRKNDRDFEVGDTLLLNEWSPITNAWTGSVQHRIITHVLRGPAFGIPEGYAMLSLLDE